MGAYLKRFPRLACSDPALSDVSVLTLDYPVCITERNVLIGRVASWINDRLVANGAARYEKVAIVA